MKTGRNSEPPNKKKGVEPSKAQQEVKVTAKKQYTWEDVAKNEELKSRNKAAKEKYESDVASYNKAIKLYNEGPEDTEVKDGIKLPTAKLKGGGKATFEKDTEKWSASKMNKMLAEQIKSGNVVPIDDPSLDATTRKLLKGAYGGAGDSDVFGYTGKKYVEKGTKYSSYKDIYGEDFNPEEFRAASKSGKFDEYSKKKGYSGRVFTPKIGFYQEYGVPKNPTLPAYEKEENIDTKKLPLTKMRTLKPGETFENIGTSKNVGKVIKPIGKLSISEKKESEIPTWEEPSGGVRTKTRIVKAKNQSLGDYIGGNIKYAVSKVTGGEPGLRGGVKKTRTALIQGKSGREAKEFKAYYGAPSSISGSDRSGMTASDIAQERESLKGVKKQLRADIKKATPGSLISKSDLKSELRNIRKDIRATNKAEKYAEKNIEARSIYPNGKEEVVVRGKEDAKSKIYNPSLGEQYSAYSRSIKSSTDNQVNKNKTFGRKVK